MIDPRRAASAAIAATIVLVAIAVLTATTARGAHEELPLGGFEVTHELVLPGTPETIYDAVSGDVSDWWDHTFSGKPASLMLDPRPGGGFDEIFDESGDGARHATVIYADRGEILRFAGPLGLSGFAVDVVYTYAFAAAGPDSTRLTLTVRANGQAVPNAPAAVDGVWHHFLFDRLKPHVEAGEHLRDAEATEDDGPGAPRDTDAGTGSR
jgi:hypothetical protein